MPALLTMAFAMTLSAYLVSSSPFWNDVSSWLQTLFLFGCLANPLLFWLLARSIFEDGFHLDRWHALLLVAVEACGFWYVSGLRTDELGTASQRLIAAAVGGRLQASSITLVIAALVTAYRGRAPDLVESRRNFRTRFVTVAGGYMVFVIVVDVFLRGAAPHPIASLFHAAAIFTIVFYFAASLLTLKINLLFEPLHTPAPVLDLEVVERMPLDQLDAAIAKQAFQQEGLTIGHLASQLGTQEHRLRRLINAKMGFRNFNDFLNHHRIRVACQQLADPTPRIQTNQRAHANRISPSEVGGARLTSRTTGQPRLIAYSGRLEHYFRRDGHTIRYSSTLFWSQKASHALLILPVLDSNRTTSENARSGTV